MVLAESEGEMKLSQAEKERIDRTIRRLREHNIDGSGSTIKGKRWTIDTKKGELAIDGKVIYTMLEGK
jgi:hypothetical protein